ncbi:hypothetical protein V6N13_054220 [Hibiscus sabdariffa]
MADKKNKKVLESEKMERPADSPTDSKGKMEEKMFDTDEEDWQKKLELKLAERKSTAAKPLSPPHTLHTTRTTHPRCRLSMSVKIPMARLNATPITRRMLIILTIMQTMTGALAILSKL